MGRVLAVVLGMVILVYCASRFSPDSYIFRDGSFYELTNYGIAENFSLEQYELQPRSWYEERLGWNRNVSAGWSNVALGEDGSWYPKHSWLMPALSTPFYLSMGKIGLLVFNVLAVFMMLLFAFRIGARLAGAWPAALMVAAFYLPSMALDKLTYCYAHDVMTSAFFLGAIDLIMGGRHRVGGLLAGFAIWGRPYNVLVLLPFLLLFVFPKRRWRPLGEALAFAAIPLTIFAAANTAMFGAPWELSYNHVLITENYEMVTEDHALHLNKDFWEGLGDHLWGSASGPWGATGLFRAFPAAILLIPGAVILWRRRWWLGTAFTGSLVINLALLARWEWADPRRLMAVTLLHAGVAALALRSTAAPETEPPPQRRIRWRHFFGAVALLLAISGGWRAIDSATSEERLADRLRTARVALGNFPCDFYNPTLDAWECSRHDKKRDWFTGLVPRYGDKAPDVPEGTLRMTAHSRRTRTFELPEPPPNLDALRVKLAGRSKPTRLVIYVGEDKVHDAYVPLGDDWTRIELPPFEGRSLRLSLHAPKNASQGSMIFVVDG